MYAIFHWEFQDLVGRGFITSAPFLRHLPIWSTPHQVTLPPDYIHAHQDHYWLRQLFTRSRTIQAVTKLFREGWGAKSKKLKGPRFQTKVLLLLRQGGGGGLHFQRGCDCTHLTPFWQAYHSHPGHLSIRTTTNKDNYSSVLIRTMHSFKSHGK